MSLRLSQIIIPGLQSVWDCKMVADLQILSNIKYSGQLCLIGSLIAHVPVCHDLYQHGLNVGAYTLMRWCVCICICVCVISYNNGTSYSVESAKLNRTLSSGLCLTTVTYSLPYLAYDVMITSLVYSCYDVMIMPEQIT